MVLKVKRHAGLPSHLFYFFLKHKKYWYCLTNTLPIHPNSVTTSEQVTGHFKTEVEHFLISLDESVRYFVAMWETFVIQAADYFPLCGKEEFCFLPK